jgi:NAD(P)-dependent dehydrogenase (short-subunit alcohol dehydrogenase family)
MNLAGAVAVVTGGAHRLGRAIVLELARAGCHVTINYNRSAAAAAETLAAARTLDSAADSFQADVGEPTQAAALVDHVTKRFGRIDLLVANAGVFRRTPLDRATADDWDDMLRGNLGTFLHCAQRVGTEMRERGGTIIALADVAALRPWADYLPYCVSKACVVALVRALAVELAPRVRVNAIAPGPVLFPDDFDPAHRQREIDRTLLRREGSPADVAAAVLFLARADYVTGVVLPVDGGRLLFNRER